MHARTASAMFALAIGLAACQQSAAPDASVTAYENAQVWTGEGFAPGAIYVRDGVIVAAPDTGAGTTVDLGGAYVIPALGEAHNHNLDQPPGAKAVSNIYLSQGIYYVKNPNSVAQWAPDVREKLTGNDTVDAIFSMGGITITGGHPERLYVVTLSQYGGYTDWTRERFLGQAFNVVDAPEDIGPAFDNLDAQDADFIKTYLLYSEEFEERRDSEDAYGMKGLSPELYAAVVEEAHRRGYRVSTHVETAFDFRTAVAGGVDEINHLPGYFWLEGRDAETYRLTDADIAAAREAGVVVITTTGLTEGIYQGRPPEQLAAVQEVQADNIRRLIDGGVTVAIGSDNYMSTARSEASHLVKLGLTPAEVLKLWIDTAPKTIFTERRIGCLQIGCEADFIAMTGDPSADLAALDSLTLRIKGGVDLDAD